MAFEHARRNLARIVIGVAGQSGSGKTYTALQLAFGLAKGDADRIFVIDTENGRAGLYADALVDRDGVVRPFRMERLDAPHSPARYIEQIKAAQKAGAKVLLIDSLSHAWEGIGGAIEFGTGATKSGAEFINWAKVKREHRKLMDHILACDMDVVVCFRAREKVRIDGSGNSQVYVALGELPVTEKNVVFDMTALVHVHERGTVRTHPKSGPDGMREHLEHDRKHLTARDGYMIRQWLDGATASPDVRDRDSAVNRLRLVVSDGLAALESAWKALGSDDRAAVGMETYATLQASARAYDAENARLSGAADGEAGDLGALLGGDDDE